jgi:hypothetical protein
MGDMGPDRQQLALTDGQILHREVLLLRSPPTETRTYQRYQREPHAAPL